MTTWIRATHGAAFRTDQWAQLDFWVIHDTWDPYEFLATTAGQTPDANR